MKKLIPVALLLIAILIGWSLSNGPDSGPDLSRQNDSAISQAFAERKSGIQVAGSGIVIKILADDNEQSRHQRFIVKLDSGQTLLISHNIDLAPRLPGLRKGDVVSFYGEYEWNAKGGVIHWTHHDPAGRHVAGWLKFKGQTYQ